MMGVVNKQWLAALLLGTGAVWAAPTLAQLGPPQSGIEVSDPEMVMTMRVDGEIYINPDGTVDRYILTTPDLKKDIVELIDNSIPHWKFEPLTDFNENPTKAKSSMRLTLVAHKQANSDYLAKLENVRLHEGVLGVDGEPETDLSTRKKSIHLIRMPKTKYPVQMLAANVNAAALAYLLISPRGKVKDVVVTQSSMFQVVGDSKELARVRRLMEKEVEQSVRGALFQLPDEVTEDLSGYMLFNFLTSKNSKLHKAGLWRLEQRGPRRAASWQLEKGIRVGVADFDGSEGVVPDTIGLLKPVSGVPTL